MQLYQHQTEGTAWLASIHRGGLFDEQGLGKTATAIVACEHVKARRVLVLAPTVVAYHWQREFHRWSTLQAQVVRTGSDVFRGEGAVIVSHGLTLREPLQARLLAQQWDVVVLDEAHAFKSPAAQRSRLVYRGRARAGTVRTLFAPATRVWALTGTPVPNGDPAELWTMLSGLAPDRLVGEHGRPMTYAEFRSRYCVLAYSPFTPDRQKVVGVQRVVELKQRMAGFSLRRLKRDHLRLPPVRFGTVGLTVDWDACVGPDLIDAEVALRAEMQKADGVPPMTRFSTWRRLCGAAKAPAAVTLLASELEGTAHKVVVFAHHRAVIETLVAGLAAFGVMRIAGEDSAAARQAAVEQFQTGTPRVAVCHIVAGGTGITLTAASDVVFVEFSPVPGENAQAADRCCRIGQTRPVLVRYLTLAGSVDALLGEILMRKASMLQQVLPCPGPWTGAR